MDFAPIVAELLGTHRMSQPQIAAHCKCAQSSISAIARAETKDPRHSIGEALIELLAQKRQEAAKAAEEAPPPPANGAAVDRREPARVNEFPDLDRRAAEVGG